MADQPEHDGSSPAGPNSGSNPTSGSGSNSNSNSGPGSSPSSGHAQPPVVVVKPTNRTIGGTALTILFALAMLVAAAFGYTALRSAAAEDILRDRLRRLVEEDYRALQDRYNDAVRQTAVTELVVAEGELSVRVRNAEGVLEEITTPYNPAGEIYVDYVVLDGRLWIRRVFDEATPPRDGIVINPSLAEIDWQSEDEGPPTTNTPADLSPDGPFGRELSHGQTIYRAIGEGRWIITVSGDGALGLAKAPEDRLIPLESSPLIGGYDELEEQLDAELDQIGPLEVLGRLLGGP